MRHIAIFLLVPLLAAAGCRQAPTAQSAASPRTAAAPAATAAQNPDTGKAGWRAYGPLQLGIDAEQLRQSWQGPLQGQATTDGGCYYLTPSAPGGAGVNFMIEGGEFVRYDVHTAGETAPGGGRVGMTLGELQALYPQADAPLPHKYVEGGHYVRVPAPDGGGQALVFELDAGGTVPAWRAGLSPQVDYVEGCS